MKGGEKALKPETTITQCAKFLNVNRKYSKGGQCGEMSRKKGNSP